MEAPYGCDTDDRPPTPMLEKAANAGGAVSSEERARILKDPVVKSVLDLFDGQLIYVQRGPQVPADEVTE